MNQTVVSPLGERTKKSIVSSISSFGKEEIEDTIDYHLVQNCTEMNINSITLPIELYVVRYQ